MAGIFSMDDELDLSNKTENLSLNYKFRDTNEMSDDESVLSEKRDIFPSEMEGPFHRRKSSIILSSYEIGIHGSYVSPLTQKGALFPSYKPKLTDFEPVKVLGQGAYGKVLLVKEKSTGLFFAQKQLKKVSLVINETNEIHQKNFNRTVNEKSILAMVRHPNIVTLHYAFQDNNKCYLILEYLSGGELFYHLAHKRYLSEKDSSYYIAQMVLALKYLHSEIGVIYRDLKPENCMLNLSGNLVLTDFGLSKVSNDEVKHSMTGTIQFMAPEILKGEPYDFAVDWWSLGCVAFDLLTGSSPFPGNNHKKVMDKIISAKKHLKFPFYLSEDAKDFLRKLLQPNPEKRFDVDNNFELLKRHRFFRYVDWNQLEKLNEPTDILPPILPVVTDPSLAENFDTEFTEMNFTPTYSDFKPSNFHTSQLPELLHVKDFTYTNESYLCTKVRNT